MMDLAKGYILIPKKVCFVVKFLKSQLTPKLFFPKFTHSHRALRE